VDAIKAALDRLSELSDGEIADLEGQILTEFGTFQKQDPTRETVDTMTALADALDAVRNETTRRTDEQAELTRRAAEAASRVQSQAEEEKEPAAPEAVPDAPAPDAVPEAPAAPEEAPAEEPAAPDEEEAKKKVPVLADEVAAPEETAPPVAAAVAEVPAAALSDTTAVTDPAVPEVPAAELSDGTSEQKETEVAMTASVENAGQVVVTPPAGNRPVVREDRAGVNLTIRAGADIPGFGAGQQLTSMEDVARAFAGRLHTLRNVSGGIGEQHTVASLEFSFPDDRQLVGDDNVNLQRIGKVEALTAAAGVCAPLETLYDINVCGVTDQPVRDALTRFNADRGGVRIYPAPTLDAANSVGFWDSSAPTAKVCADAKCSTPQDIMLDAIYACMKFSNFTSRFFPEIVKANTDLALIHHARVSDQFLLKNIQSQSTKVTATSTPAGVTRSVVYTIRQAAVGIRRRFRLASNAPMRVILPSWLLDMMVADIALQMPGDGLESLSIAEAKLRSIFSDANVNVTWALDSIDAAGAPSDGTAQAAGALNPFPTTVDFPIFPEGTFLFLDGGTLDLGVVRDMSTNTANEYATFVESFVGVAKTGCESLWVTLSGLCVSGAAAALVDTGCV
jgi:hypothetical protein